MTKLAIPLSILAVALAGCGAPAYRPAVEAAAPIVPQPTGYHAGTGVVQNVMLAPAPMGATGSTASGATNRPEPPVGMPSDSTGRLQRLAIKMDRTGEVQYVDTDSHDFTKGARVELTSDGKIRKL
jgi:hypothetical protein